eukprot:Phypoly_transcript_28205.p1 GENE.Phypoly_transcript_28205~~Phypoly_transcript_28205.p1  ORF type:complete len:124 (+),score=14.50 Phypoly_transcript_28205:44-415(+)
MKLMQVLAVLAVCFAVTAATGCAYCAHKVALHEIGSHCSERGRVSCCSSRDGLQDPSGTNCCFQMCVEVSPNLFSDPTIPALLQWTDCISSSGIACLDGKSRDVLAFATNIPCRKGSPTPVSG